MEFHPLITHIVCESLPNVAGIKKQASPICSSTEDIAQNHYFLGYAGSRRLHSDDLNSSEIYALKEPLAVTRLASVWIDSDRNVYLEEPNVSNDQWKPVTNFGIK